MSDLQRNKTLLSSITEVIQNAKEKAFRNSNSILLQMYWEIGRLIVEDEQEGKPKADYGKAILKNLSYYLTIEFGKGFDERNLNNVRAFYLAFPIWNAVRTELSWTHYRILSRVEEGVRMQYTSAAIEQGWDTRSLQRNIKPNTWAELWSLKNSIDILHRICLKILISLNFWDCHLL